MRIARLIFFSFCLIALLFGDLSRNANALAIPDLSLPGPFQAGWTNVTIPRTGSAGTFEARLFYPAVTAGQDSAFDSSGGPYPVIAFAHEYFPAIIPGQDVVAFYNLTLTHLASYGYFVVAPTSLDYTAVNGSVYAHDLSDCLSYLEAQNSTNSTPYYQMVNTNAFGVSGHSLGGGASLLAAATDQRIKAVANLAAEADTTPPAVDAVRAIHVPLRLIAASNDITTPVDQHQQPVYDAASAPKQLAVFQGANHCNFADNPLSFDWICGTPTMPKETQLTLTRLWLTQWFNYYLKGDASLEPVIWGPDLTADPRVVVQFVPLIKTKIVVYIPFLLH